MIANRDQRYSTIAKACLSVLNHQSFHKKTTHEQIAAVYAAIDNAFNENQKKMLNDLELLLESLKKIRQLAETENNTDIIQITDKILG